MVKKVFVSSLQALKVRDEPAASLVTRTAPLLFFGGVGSDHCAQDLRDP